MTVRASRSSEWPMRKQQGKLGWPVDKPEQQHGELGWPVDKWVAEQGQQRLEHPHTICNDRKEHIDGRETGIYVGQGEHTDAGKSGIYERQEEPATTRRRRQPSHAARKTPSQLESPSLCRMPWRHSSSPRFDVAHAATLVPISRLWSPSIRKTSVSVLLRFLVIIFTFQSSLASTDAADASSRFVHVGRSASLVRNSIIRIGSSRLESQVESAADRREAGAEVSVGFPGAEADRQQGRAEAEADGEGGMGLERAAAVRWRAERQLMVASRAAAAGGWVGALGRPRVEGNVSAFDSTQTNVRTNLAGIVPADVTGNVGAAALRSRKLAAAKLPSQKGFVSIDCGYMGSAGASNLGLKWLPDTAAPGGSVAVITRVPDHLVGLVTVEQTLRVFDDGKPSNCYQIPLVAPGRYLVRLTFWYGNYDGKNMPPIFNVTVGTASLGQYTPSNDQILVLEVIVTVPARTMAICLVRVSADPIINALEIRPLPAGAYNESDYSEQLLLNYWRLSCAGDSWLVGSYRYPDDPLDRVWYADMPLFGDPAPGTYTYIPASASVAVTSSSIAIPPSMSSNAVPQFVVQKARTTKGAQGLTYRFYGLAPGKYQAYLYFTDIIPPTAPVTTTNTPSADLLLAVLINGSPLLRNAPALPPAANRQWNKNTAGQLSFAFDVVGAAAEAGGNATASAQGAGQGNGQGNGQEQGAQGTVAETSIQLKAEEGSRVKEVGLAGLELYTVVEPKAAVPKEQVSALKCIKAQMGVAAALDGWTGDPCYPIVWPGVICKTTRQHSSVIGLNLTHLNIPGPFSACISDLTALQTLWMDHNQLQGSIPSSIGNLAHLRSIKLNNNKLSGPVPTALAALPNLQYLDLSSNNLSGPFPFNSSSNVQIGISGNINLCSPGSSFGLPPCNLTTTTAPSSSSDTSAQAATSPAAMSTAVLMALILGVIIGVLLVLLASWLLLRWQQRAAEGGGMGGRSSAGGGGGGVGGDGLGQQPPVVVYVHGDTGAVTVQAADSAGATLYTQSNQVLLSPKAAAGLTPAAVTAAAAAKTAAIEGTGPPAVKAGELSAVPASQEETPLLAPAPGKPLAAAGAAAGAAAAVGVGAATAVGGAVSAAAAAVSAAPREGTAKLPANEKTATIPCAVPAVGEGLAVGGAAASAGATNATDSNGASATPAAAAGAVTAATAPAATPAAATPADHSMACIVAPGSSARRFTLATLSTATNHFSPSEIIGSGGFGPVYRGVLPDGRMVAVKRRDDDSLQGDREFVNEVDLLSRACHPNLVELVGYCREARQHLLVYEFMPNGTVREHLYDQMGQPLGRLRWLTRIQIALGAARAIQYLHTCLQPPIIHRDIKTSNILLDGRLNARVADFGLSRVGPQDNRSHVSTVVKGTAGYLDPEYFTIQQLTDRSDVFSFGVVLLELISGQQPIDLNRPQQHWSIIDWARDHLQQGNIRAVADPTLFPQEWDEEAMWRVAEVGMVCVEPKSLNRPPITEVVAELEHVLALEVSNAANAAAAAAAAAHAAAAAAANAAAGAVNSAAARGAGTAGAGAAGAGSGAAAGGTAVPAPGFAAGIGDPQQQRQQAQLQQLLLGQAQANSDLLMSGSRASGTSGGSGGSGGASGVSAGNIGRVSMFSGRYSSGRFRSSSAVGSTAVAGPGAPPATAAAAPGAVGAATATASPGAGNEATAAVAADTTTADQTTGGSTDASSLNW